MLRKPLLVGASVTVSLLLALSAQAQPPDMKAYIAAAPEGARVWQNLCDGCHGPPDAGVPARTVLATKTGDEVYFALTQGKMKSIGEHLNDSEKRSIAIYLTGRPLTAVSDAPAVPPAAVPPAV